MPRFAPRRALALITLALGPGLTGAQEGFPLDGTWRGTWGDPAASHHVVIVMQWDGRAVTGRINPGPRSIEFTEAALLPENWGVRIEAVDASGDEIRIVGTLEDIGSPDRSIVGTWRQGDETHPFRIERQ